jgi:hypothetical protein
MARQRHGRRAEQGKAAHLMDGQEAESETLQRHAPRYIHPTNRPHLLRAHSAMNSSEDEARLLVFQVSFKSSTS